MKIAIADGDLLSKTLTLSSMRGIETSFPGGYLFRRALSIEMKNSKPPNGAGASSRDSVEYLQTSVSSWAAIIGAVFVQLVMSCACGHLYIKLLPVTFGLLVLAIIPCTRPKYRTLVGLLGFAVTFLLFSKNVADSLWLGHEPLFWAHWQSRNDGFSVDGLGANDFVDWSPTAAERGSDVSTKPDVRTDRQGCPLVASFETRHV